MLTDSRTNSDVAPQFSDERAPLVVIPRLYNSWQQVVDFYRLAMDESVRQLPRQFVLGI